MAHYPGPDLQQRRLQLSLSTRQLAKQLSVSHVAISRWERGENFPPITIWDAWASAVGAAVEVVVYDTPLDDRGREALQRIVQQLPHLRTEQLEALEGLLSAWEPQPST
jgi:transcriptional regulator with XRE-family HTH domain